MITTLPFMVCLFWLIFLLLEWHRVSAATHLLSLFAAVAAVLYLCHAIYFNDHTEYVKYSNTAYAFCNIAVFPVYYLYLCRLTHEGKLPAKIWAVLLPAVIIGIWSAICYFIYPENEQLEFWRNLTAKTVFLIQLVLVAYFGSKRIRAFDRRIMDFYADTENRVANMTRDIIFILCFCVLISMVFSYLGREYFFNRSVSLYVPSLLFSVCLYAVLYIGYRQTFTADDLARDEELPDSECETGRLITWQIPEEEPATQAEDDESRHDDYRRVCQMVEKNRWYLKPDLRLPELAMLMGMGRTRLSAIINENAGVSFSDFINKYRIEHACRIMKTSNSNKEFLLTSIGEQCGFTSDSSFYRSFRKITGMTPSQYRQKLQGEANEET